MELSTESLKRRKVYFSATFSLASQLLEPQGPTTRFNISNLLFEICTEEKKEKEEEKLHANLDLSVVSIQQNKIPLALYLFHICDYMNKIPARHFHILCDNLYRMYTGGIIKAKYPPWEWGLDEVGDKLNFWRFRLRSSNYKRLGV